MPSSHSLSAVALAVMQLATCPNPYAVILFTGAACLLLGAHSHKVITASTMVISRMGRTMMLDRCDDPGSTGVGFGRRHRLA